MLKNQSVQGNRRARRSRKVALKFGAAFAATMILAGGIITTSLFTPSAAHAVSEGAGLGTGSTFVGAFMHSDGSTTYCAELGKLVVLGNNPTMNEVTALPAYSNPWLIEDGVAYNNLEAPALSGSGLTTLNYVLSHWGNTSDDAQAAAVQIAIWQIRAAGASQSYMDLFAYYKNSVGSGVVARSNQMIAEAQNANTAVSQPGDPRINTSSPYAGSVTVDPGTTSLTIENAVFTQTGTNTITFAGGTTSVIDVPFVGIPPHDAESWDRHYVITVNGTYEYQVSGGEVKYGNPGGVADQGIVSAGPAEKRTGNYDAVYMDPDTIWSPTLSTQVPSEFIQKGDSFSDTVTFGVAENLNPWRKAILSDGEIRYAPITANGTLYGPFLVDPALNPSATPPVGAPVAATVTVTTDTITGPGTYEFDTGDTVSKESGYYSWVWNIEFDSQLPSVKAPAGTGETSLPENYFFTDGFGQVTEGQITPTSLRWSTELSTDTVSIGGSFTDDVHVTLKDGGWLQTDGTQTPFVLRGTVFASDVEPSQAPAAPADAEVVATSELTVTQTGTVTSDAISIPFDTDANYLTVQWCLADEDQAPNAVGKAEEWCDDYGVPSETAEISRPQVETTALGLGAYKGDIHDVAHVDGSIVDGAKNEIDFTYYFQPQIGEPKYDENWEVVLDEDGEPVLWTADELTDPEAFCLAQPVATTDRVEVTSTGDVKSPNVVAHSVGEGYWVERYYVTPEGGDEVLLHEGKCGLENEKTTIEYPKVSTEAKSNVKVGEEIFDTAIVTGPISDRVDYKVTFKAYKQTGDELVCTAENEIKDFEDATGVKVTEAGSYESMKVVTTEEHIGHGGYVETLTKIESGEETVIHVGKCGEPSEAFEVTEKPALALTGMSNLNVMSLMSGGLLAAGAAFWLVTQRRKKALVEGAVSAE